MGSTSSSNLRIHISNCFRIENLLYFSTTSSLSENNITPVVVYTNGDTQKLDILKDNKGKSGVYR